MNKTVYNDFSKATNVYINNKHLLEEKIKGKLFNIELDSKELSELLDQHASTDMFLKTKNNSIYGVALRINFNKSWHKNVTIRYKRKSGTQTEYEKTINAIKKNAINAAIGLQLDCDNISNIIRGIIYDRYTLFNIINSNIKLFENSNMHTVKSDGNKMLYFNYDFFNQQNIKHYIFYIDSIN